MKFFRGSVLKMADDVLVDKLFNYICGSGGFVELSVLLRRPSPLASRKSVTEARNWLKTQREFVLVKDGNGEITGVRIDLRKKVCQQYAMKGSCRRRKGMCKYWHICKSFIEGKCDGTCGLSHDFHKDGNNWKVEELGLEKYSNGALRNIVAWSLPQVCQQYLRNECASDKCPCIHVCTKAVRGSPCNCALSHNLTDSHNMMVLKQYDLVPPSQIANVDFVRCSILVLGEESTVRTVKNLSEGATPVGSKTPTENAVTSKTATANAVTSKTATANAVASKTAAFNAVTRQTAAVSAVKSTTGHIHQERPNASICSGFLVGQCKRGVNCSDHHCSLPYQWQYKAANVDVWRSFSDQDNLALEKLYCDVNTESRVNFKPSQALDLSLLKSKPGIAPVGRRHGITIDLDNMSMFLTPAPDRCVVVSQLHVRRLSTKSNLICPNHSMATSWTWYWKENDNVWHMYGKDRSGRDLQHLIERAFLDQLEQGKTRESFRFATPEHEYTLFFYSTGMYQVNLQTGNPRPVKRRPVKFVSNEDVEDLKRECGDASVKMKLNKMSASYKYIPSHWFPMPPGAQYRRITLTRSSGEFKDVEQLFKRTMNDDYVVIVNIDRVQNPFMMEKYCRKKENMKATAKHTHQTINEKRLFHGTSPDTVEAICKQNFDWRLHGKNATVYGEGSYFAVNASYSHAYAKRDVNLSQFMFLAKVLVGSYTTGHSSYRRPPPKKPADPASDLYDSCVDNQSNPSIFVVFDTDQFYPEYVIEYSTTSQTAPTQARRSQSHTGILRPSAYSTNQVGRASNPSVPAVRSVYYSTTVSPKPSAHLANGSSHLVSATNRSSYPSVFNSSHGVAASSSNGTAVQSWSNNRYPAPSNSKGSADQSTLNSTSRYGYSTATSANAFPEKEKKKDCLIM